MSDSTPPPVPGDGFPPPPAVQPPTTGGYPARLAVDLPDTIARWRVIGNIILAIPHFLILYVLAIVAEVVVIAAWFVGLVTGRIPEGMLSIVAMFLRYQARVGVYASFLNEDYPPFAFSSSFADPGDYPNVRVDLQAQVENRSRLTIFFRLILAIPHLIVISILSVIAYVFYIIAWFAVLITGSWPAPLRRFIIGYLQWNVRLSAYLMLATDQYPPLSFED